MTPSQRLDATFAALADPTRRAILARLAQGDASVTELAEPFAMSQPAISKHLKVLEHAGPHLDGAGRAAPARARSKACASAKRPPGSRNTGSSGSAVTAPSMNCSASCRPSLPNQNANASRRIQHGICREDKCDWLQDTWGVSWQIIPDALGRYLGDPDREKANRVMQAMSKMKNIVVADLDRATAA